VAELPTQKPGKTPPQKYAHVLWAEDGDGRILMQRRPASGIWASLWTLPQADDDALAQDWFQQHLTGDYTRAQVLAPIDHAFSHYKLQLQPLRWRGAALRGRISDNDDLRWVAREELGAIGIPAPIRKLLEASTRDS
jgi:A/G-specific adenine glycosylase